jgi:hypothetical protein
MADILDTPDHPPAAIGGNRLAVLAAEIQEADARCRRSIEAAATAAIEAGHKLNEAKELVGHGNWLPWLRDYCHLSERSAQRYMRIARSGVISAIVADLGVAAVDRALATHAPTIEAEPEPEPEPYDFGIPINDVKFVRDLYPRSEFDLEYVKDLADRLDLLPPIEVNQHNELIDGRYRWEAHKARGMRRIRVVVTEVKDRLEHKILAVKRNCSPNHGIPWTRRGIKGVTEVDGIQVDVYAEGLKEFPNPPQQPQGVDPDTAELAALIQRDAPRREEVRAVEAENLDPETEWFTKFMRARGCRGIYSPTGATFPDDLTYEEWLHIGHVLRTMPNNPDAAPIAQGYVSEGLRRAKAAPFKPERFKSKQEFLSFLAVDAASAEGRGALMKKPTPLDDDISPKGYEQIEIEWWDNKNKEATKDAD